MAEKIRLVQGDRNRPQVQASLTNEADGTPIDLSVGGTATVVLKFRQAGSTTLLTTVSGIVLNPAGGVVVFPMSEASLAGEPGDYEGEIEVTFPNGDVQTAYELLKFKVREDF